MAILKSIRNLIPIFFFLSTAGFSSFAQYNAAKISETRNYIRFMDSLSFRFSYHPEDMEQDNVTMTGLISINPPDTIEKVILQNIKGDTVYRIQYHDNIDKEFYESYYLKNNLLIAAKIELKEFDSGPVYYHKIVHYENGLPVFKDSSVEKIAGNNFKRTIPSINRKEFNHLPDFLTYKKNKLLDITKKHLADNYIVLLKYNNSDINFMATGDSLQEYISCYSTIIHEGFHTYENILNSFTDSFRHYRLNDTITVSIKKFTSYPAKQLNDFVKKQLRDEGRYNIYINSRDSINGTQSNGFLGILEEYAAYFQGLKALVATFYYLKEEFQFNSTPAWRNYLNDVGDLYAINEFRLFISWYLQYSRLKYPDLFTHITNDRNIKILFTHVEKESKKLLTTYFNNRKLILNRDKPFIEKDAISKKFPNDKKMRLSTDFVIKNLYYTDSLLNLKEHKVLGLLRH